MSRPRAGKAAVNVSLFPFLAVLICTMGALILLLVVIAEQTRRNAAAAETHQVEAAGQETARLASTVQQLTGQRDELVAAFTRQQGANAVLKSATVAAEVERERLADELAARTSRDEDSDDDSSAALLADIAELDDRIAKSRGERDRLAGIADRGSKSFAVVPYQGNYGTRRRPLYIECTASSVILQPEGVLIDPADLDTPFGRTNPLSHAIEAASDHLLRLQHTDAGKPGIPYPLLLVRPGGIENFYLARRALQATASEFGYELIEGDWELDYPEVDAELVLVMSDAVKNARRAQLHLARSAPRLRRSSPFVEDSGDGGTGYGGSGHGGSGNDGSGGGPDENGGDGTFAEASRPETAFPDGHFGGSGTLPGAVGSDSLASVGTANTTTGTGGTGAAGAGLTSSGDSLNPTASGSSGRGSDGGGAGQPPGDAFSFDNTPVATGSSASQPSFDDTAASSSGGGAPGPQLVAPGQTGGSTGKGSRGSSSAVTPSAGGYAADMAAGDAGGAGGAAGTGASSGTGSSGGGSTSSAGSPGANMSAGSSAAGAHDNNNSSQSSQGRTRGTDNRDSGKPGRDTGEQPWALANTASGAVPVTRPIRVRIDADRITLLSADGRQERQVVRFVDNARDTVGDVVSAVWDRTESWGLAGRGLYWSPVLIADVAPDGFGRLEQLQRMLAGSGIELKPRAAPKSAARPVPEKRWLR